MQRLVLRRREQRRALVALQLVLERKLLAKPDDPLRLRAPEVMYRQHRLAALYDGIQRLLALQYPHHLLSSTPLASRLRFARRTADVGRQEHVLEREQRMILARRLAFHDIDRRASDALLGQARSQRVLIDDTTARQIDEERRLLHQAELARADHM